MKNCVIPIPPSYNPTEDLDVEETIKYCNYLIENGATRLMTTAGTTQFNLLSISEIHKLNTAISKLDCEKILGVPALSLKHTIEFIRYANTNYDPSNTSLLLLFPDRFYDYEDVTGFFHMCAQQSFFPCYIHGMPMRKATGGMFDFDSKLINMIAKHPRLVGMKEEHSSLASSYKVINNVVHKDFEIIVAGGSMRRFLFLETAGAHTFLSGVGNIFPEIENKFVKAVNRGDRKEANAIVADCEAICFNKFMSVGWHKALRTSLRFKKLGCFWDRKPFTPLNNDDKTVIIDALARLEKYNGQ